MTFTHGLSTNNYGPAKFIVSASASLGTHLTIASALAVASSGDTIFIRNGSYTENLTLVAGVNLAAFDCDALTPNVTIIGTCTFTTAGSVSISGIRLQTNSAFAIAVTGSAASVLQLINCYINCSNNTGISFTSSDANAVVRLINCQGDIGTTGISVFSHSSAGLLSFRRVQINNSGGSSTASTASAGNLNIYHSILSFPITTSGTNSPSLRYSEIGTSATNTTTLTHGGATSGGVISCFFQSGTASAVSISTTLTMADCTVNSSNTNAVTGAGTLVNAGIFLYGSQVINTTTQTARALSVGGITFDGGTNILQNYATGTFVPTMVGRTSAGTTSYSSQNGYYTRIGNIVFVQARITIASATGTGDALFGSLPFTVKNQTNGSPAGDFFLSAAGWAWPVAAGYLSLQAEANSTNASVFCSGSSSGGGILQVANAVATFVYSVTYQI